MLVAVRSAEGELVLGWVPAHSHIGACDCEIGVTSLKADFLAELPIFLCFVFEYPSYSYRELKLKRKSKGNIEQDNHSPRR